MYWMWRPCSIWNNRTYIGNASYHLCSTQFSGSCILHLDGCLLMTHRAREFQIWVFDLFVQELFVIPMSPLNVWFQFPLHFECSVAQFKFQITTRKCFAYMSVFPVTIFWVFRDDFFITEFAQNFAILFMYFWSQQIFLLFMLDLSVQ